MAGVKIGPKPEISPLSRADINSKYEFISLKYHLYELLNTLDKSTLSGCTEKEE